MDSSNSVTHVSLCAGYGGIDLGLKRAIPNLRTVAFSEIEAFAVSNLVAKMEAGFLDAAPVWTDLKTFPWEEFRDRVDILSGGYPCQPFSSAGKRLGKDDPRHLWPFIADGISRMRPSVCFFENVEGHISLGLSTVVSDLEELGYKVAWGIFSAAEVGAPHQRKRVFILAHRIGERGQLSDWRKQPTEQVLERDGAEGRDVWPSCPSELADAAIGRRNRQHAGSGSNVGEWATPEDIGSATSHSSCCGGTQVWPSRPGQPQHEWEPPRVVVNSTRNESQQRESGELEETERPRESSNDAATDAGSIVGNTSQLQRDGSNDNGGNGKRSEAVSESGDTSWQSMGNADCGRLSFGINAGSSREENGRRQSHIEQTESGQAEPSLGGNADGSASRLDYAELCVSFDNRTDELRLLGNGVVPATAERAFRILSQQISL